MPQRITLSTEQYLQLKALDKDIEFARSELERAKRVGLDVSELERYLNEVVELRNRIMEEYKPEGVE